MRKPAFCICENKDTDQLRSNCAADQRLVFATRIVQSLFYLNPKFQASCHLLWLYSPVCVGPGRKPRRPVFSQRVFFYSRRCGDGHCVSISVMCDHISDCEDSSDEDCGKFVHSCTKQGSSIDVIVSAISNRSCHILDSSFLDRAVELRSLI